MIKGTLSRRRFARAVAGAGALWSVQRAGIAAAHAPQARLRWILGSCMYGTTAVEEVVAEVPKTGATHIDLWPRPHGNQREQIDEMGHDRFAEILDQHGVGLGILTRYDLGPTGLADEIKVAQRFGARLIVSGSGGPKNLAGDDLRRAMNQFAERMKPHIDAAAAAGVTIAIENHSGSLLSSPESLKRFRDAFEGPGIGVALAPYHLPQDEPLLAELITYLGDALVHFYAWQHGMGCMEKLPKEQELLQMPGRGELDFAPLLAALGQIEYRGWTEVFMHPVPRGIPILDTAAAVTREINQARHYLESLVA